MVIICGLYDGHLLPIYLLQAIYSFSRDPHSTPVPKMFFDEVLICVKDTFCNIYLLSPVCWVGLRKQGRGAASNQVHKWLPFISKLISSLCGEEARRWVSSSESDNSLIKRDFLSLASVSRYTIAGAPGKTTRNYKPSEPIINLTTRVG